MHPCTCIILFILDSAGRARFPRCSTGRGTGTGRETMGFWQRPVPRFKRNTWVFKHRIILTAVLNHLCIQAVNQIRRPLVFYRHMLNCCATAGLISTRWRKAVLLQYLTQDCGKLDSYSSLHKSYYCIIQYCDKFYNFNICYTISARHKMATNCTYF